MKKLLFVISTLLASIFFLAAKKPVEEEFKNLKVLPKNISSDSLYKIMDSFNEGLGVTCNYCHYKNKETNTVEYESDNKAEKEISRKMMLMTNDINKNFFAENSSAAQSVTCYTCHHANPIPAIDTADFNRKSAY